MLVLHLRAARSAHDNLALEEALVRSAKEDMFLLWRDTPSVIIGRSQNALAQIDRDYIESNGIDLVRRLSGGGAVYHDEGNLCFSFIAARPGDTMGDQAAYIDPVVAALRRLGLPAEREGRNDISVGGKKVSGNAQYALEGRLCHHGTLLVDANLNALESALRPDPNKVRGKGVASVRARVANIGDFLPGMDAEALGCALEEDILRHGGDARSCEVPPGILAQGERIAAERYRSDAWNYGSEPAYDYRSAARFPGGSVEVLLQVERGIIEGAAVYGDFLALRGAEAVERAMVGQRHDRSLLREALAPAFEGHGLGGVSLEEFLTLF